ncbi:6-pyruvoyl trahydropterin synthase family protein [Methylobrevis pamukkalensis]|uniref:6-carboxy-5,6,7,8-tetrahydropterin synthase n=1 Tax=Methylobrevis pamukkalensis TaxID=1439726 RepID=A0A1E3H5B5_9HYPH|nr:6-carboxytetrahydropterin synthase [Methylobrevis pamukkalensis]ODN70986.1 6-carboxy-5,6,7,8-tetrahydropterin synthase [Methylobrevis pamukkalensis]
MYAVEVRDHVMIAHSLNRPVFGPARGLHGATYVVDAAFCADELDEDGLVVDIGLATTALRGILKPLDYANLDERPEFAGKITTTEFLARHIFDGLAAAAKGGDLGPAGRALARLKVTLHESHVARAWYEAAL